MRYWKVCLAPHVGSCFYVVIRAETGDEAAKIAQTRYSDIRWSGTVSLAQGPERRIRSRRTAKHMKDIFTKKDVRKLINTAFWAGLINDPRARPINDLSAQNSRLRVLKHLFPNVFTEGQPGHISRVKERAARHARPVYLYKGQFASSYVDKVLPKLEGKQLLCYGTPVPGAPLEEWVRKGIAQANFSTAETSVAAMLLAGETEFLKKWLLDPQNQKRQQLDYLVAHLVEGDQSKGALAFKKRFQSLVVRHWDCEVMAAFAWRVKKDKAVTLKVIEKMFSANAAVWQLLVLGDKRAARRCLQKAEEEAAENKDDLFWTDCATAWKAFGEELEMRRCMQKAEDLATLADAWGFVCARAWINLGSEPDARRCMQKADEVATSSSEWTNCAELWQRLGESLKAQDSMRKAEALSTRAHEWAYCSRGWNKLDNELDARRCMQKGEDLAASSSEWTDCAQCWQSLGETLKARHCVQQAEGLAADSNAWTNCVRTWNVLNDEHAAVRCMRKAEESAMRSSEWTNCAWEWRSLGKSRPAVRCMREAQKLAKNYSEWSDCADQWQRLGKPLQARRCWQKAAELDKTRPLAATNC